MQKMPVAERFARIVFSAIEILDVFHAGTSICMIIYCAPLVSKLAFKVNFVCIAS